MIVDERFGTYMNSLDPGHSPFLEQLEQEAKEAYVPIIRRQMQSFLRMFLTLQKPQKVLEVGTAIGFSSILIEEDMGDQVYSFMERINNAATPLFCVQAYK